MTPCLACADDDDDDDDDYFDESALRFQMFSQRIRWAPPSKDGSRWDQRDSQASIRVQELLATEAIITLAGCEALPSVVIKDRLGEGRFGDVLLGEAEDDSSKRVAIKMALRPTSELEHEQKILEAMQGVDGFPQSIHHQRATATLPEMLVMEMLGPSLQRVWETSTRSSHLSADTVLRLGGQILRTLQSLHDAGFVHNDLKPANILLGQEGTAKEESVHLVDFGLTTSRLQKTSQSRESDEENAEEGRGGVGRVGSHLYASIAAHEGRATVAADDLESLTYLLAFLATGRLPWRGERYSSIAPMKRRMVRDGCRDLLFAGTCCAEGAASSNVATALEAVWAQVVECHQTGNEVDYDACLALLGASSSNSASSV